MGITITITKHKKEYVVNLDAKGVNHIEMCMIEKIYDVIQSYTNLSDAYAYLSGKISLDEHEGCYIPMEEKEGE